MKNRIRRAWPQLLFSMMALSACVSPASKREQRPSDLLPVEQPASIITGLVRLAGDTVLYEDEALTVAVAVLLAEGVVYAEVLDQTDRVVKIAFTPDGETLQIAYTVAKACTALSPEQAKSYTLNESGVRYANLLLTALSIACPDAQTDGIPVGYTMAVYGFPGMPDEYQMTAEEIEEKAWLASTGESSSLRDQVAGKDYVEGEVLLMTDSQEKAEQVAAAFDGTLAYRLDDGLTKIYLKHATVAQAIAASADAKTTLPAVYPNSIRNADQSSIGKSGWDKTK